ncbi:MAG: 50S ribosomal protein L6 [Clostridia bacterium]|nr:50S ribosomal protein L6 [Clostridia bacterium]
MSRIGKEPIAIPAGVEVKVTGTTVTVKGPKGTLEKNFHPNMQIAVENNEVKVTRPDDNKTNRELHGLTRALINNMVKGVSEGFEKALEINGVGYRAQKQGNKLVMNLGYSHTVEMEEPKGITVEVPTQNSIIVKGIDNEAVGAFAAEIRKKRLPEPYKGKGIKYTTETIRRKEGKTGAKK